MLTVSNLTKTRRDGTTSRAILDGLAFSMSRGEKVAITGPSGCGKSTLLHIIAGLETADAGEITLDNDPVLSLTESQLDEYRKSRIGIVFQQFNLIDCLTVEDNIFFPARFKGNPDKAYVLDMCELLGVQSLLHKKPYQTSGGEQQRVAVARALAHKPQLVLADEPTGNLDEKNSLAVAQLLVDVCQKLNTGLLMVTHSQTIAEMADRTLRLHDGRLVAA